MKSKYYFIVLLTIISNINILIAQTRKELENKKKQTELEIKNANLLLNSTKEKKKNGYNNLLILNRKVKIQESLITTINAEIDVYDERIRLAQDTIDLLERELTKLREEYAEIIQKAYMHRSKSKTFLYIWSSESFDQAYKRIKYLQQFESYKEQKAEEIRKKNKDVVERIENLNLNKEAKKTLLNENISISDEIKKDRKNQSLLIDKLKSKEKQLITRIEVNKKIAVKIQKEIQKLIEEELRKAAELAKSKNSKDNFYALTPEEKLIAENFEGNKSHLPWPTERGIITSEFGIHSHPVLKGVTINNNGIDISTTKGSYARAIFRGKVTAISYLEGINNVVLIKHGNYYSVYANLVDVMVSVNDEVTDKQIIGKIYTNKNEDDKTFLNFQIWKGVKKLNPTQWIVN